MRIVAVVLAVFSPLLAAGQVEVVVSPVKIVGQTAVVPLALVNRFPTSIESARAVVFLLDAQGKAVGPPTTRWVIGGTQDRPNLLPGQTNTFQFVVGSAKPFTTTNLTAKVAFSRIVLDGGKVANVSTDVKIVHVNK